MQSMNKAVSAIIDRNLNKRKLSVRKAARDLGVPFQMLQRWKTGRDNPTTDTLIRMWIKSPAVWGRELAFECLDTRYPGVFVRPNGKGT